MNLGMKASISSVALRAVAAALAFGSLVSFADALPLRLDYTVTPTGLNYQYDFTLVLDNHDNSWTPGQAFNWLIVGDTHSAPSPFPAGPTFFTSVPAGWNPATSNGFHNGPTLCFSGACGLPGYVPAAVGEIITFTGVASVLLGAGELKWTMFIDGQQNLVFETANLNAVPLPAALPLFATVLAGGGLVAWRRKRKAAKLAH